MNPDQGYQDWRARERDVNGTGVAQTAQKDFWSDLSAGGLLRFVDDLWLTDEEKQQYAIQKATADAQIAEANARGAAAQAEAARRQAVQMGLIGLGALVVVAGGFMAYRSMSK